MAGMNAAQKETVLALNNPEQVVVDELMQAKLLRALYSDRQLEEVMTDFWFNHFNVFINKGADPILLTSYERDAIRPTRRKIRRPPRGHRAESSDALLSRQLVERGAALRSSDRSSAAGTRKASPWTTNTETPSPRKYQSQTKTGQRSE